MSSPKRQTCAQRSAELPAQRGAASRIGGPRPLGSAPPLPAGARAGTSAPRRAQSRLYNRAKVPDPVERTADPLERTADPLERNVDPLESKRYAEHP